LKSKGKIVVSKNGPYLVTGSIPLSVMVILTNEEGISWEWKEGRSFDTKPEYGLCRCGQSKEKPFCDDACKTVPFDGTETATRGSYASRAEEYQGPELVLQDVGDLCSHARFCMAAGKIWHLVGLEGPEARELVVREANHCPSGRLTLKEAGSGKRVEHELSPSIGVVEDTGKRCSGPLWVRGGVTIESEDGTRYERRNRVTLCRCGASTNKPFCNGNHKKVKFMDGFMETYS
jgi:CDGSH-type Zn-finger protein